MFKLGDGNLVSIAARGPFVFRAYIRDGRLGFIEAFDRDGCSACLHIEGKRKPMSDEFVTRPYRIAGLIRKKKERKCSIVIGKASPKRRRK